MPFAPVRHVLPVCAYLAVPPTASPRSLWPPRLRGHASFPHVLARGRPGMPRIRGPWPAGGSTPGRWCAPSLFCVRDKGSGAWPTRRRARLPASPRQPPRPPAPSPVGSAVSCASACVGAGAAAVAGSSGGAQGPGQPDVVLCVRDAENRPPHQESWSPRVLVGPSSPIHGPEDPFVVLPGHPPPRGYFPVPPVPQKEHGIEEPVQQPPGGRRGGQLQPPTHLQHQGEGLVLRGSRTALQSWPKSLRAWAGGGDPTAPRAGSARGSRPTGAAAICAGSAPGPRAAGAAAVRAGSARRSRTAGVESCGAAPCRRGSGWRGGGGGGLGGDQGPRIEVDVVVELVLVVGVVRRHLLDARGDALHRLDLQLRGLPDPLSPPSALPLPYLTWAPSSLPAVAHVAPPLLASGSLCCRRPLAPVLPVPPASLPVSLAVSCVPSSLARALAFPVRLPSPAASCACALPVPPCPSAAAGALALPLCLPRLAAAHPFAHTWCLPPSPTACHLPTVALRPSPLHPALHDRHPLLLGPCVVAAAAA